MQQYTPPPTERGSSPVRASGKRRTAPHDAVDTEDHPMTYPEPPKNIGSAPFYHWRQEKGYDLYPVLRLILPQKDRERNTYGLKEKNLAKIYIKLIPLQRTDHDAIHLMNWKKPSEEDASSGDFPTVLYEVVRKRSSVMEGSLTVQDINEVLSELVENQGHSDAQAKIMQRVYNHATAEEQKWIVRIILKGQ
ncbi:hypothetical protein EIP86_007507 [Pleurotus ostreatoroseus]|nr:hypothetical protein EIP86_007507 [Pleurotus ostreatoroseus]